MADSSQFLATMLGSGLGVVAGVAVQYGFQMLLSRRQRSDRLTDIRAEAVYNEGVVGELIAETVRLRTCCHPGGLQTTSGYSGSVTSFG
jgi:hypothetical protein